jgi:O-antigen ligase
MAGSYHVDTPAERTPSRSPTGARVLSAASNVVAFTLLFPLATSASWVRKLLLAIIILDIPIHVGIHLFWSDELGDSGALGGLEISLTTVALAALYCLWFVGRVCRRELGTTISLRPALPLALYLMFETVSLLTARKPVAGMYEVLLTAQMLFLFIYLINWVHTRSDVAFVLRMLLVGFILEAGIIVALKASGNDIEVPGLPGHTLTAAEPESADAFSRPSGTLTSPNVAASYLSVMLTVMVGLLLLTRVRASYKAVTLISVGLGLTALLFTYSRGGWLAFLTSITLICCAGWRLLRPRRVFIIAVALAALFASLLLDTPLSRRLFESDEGSAYSRLVLNKLAIRMIEGHPIIGVGANNFAFHVREYATREDVGEWLYTVHNKYLLVWAEAGLGGLLAYCWFLVASLRRGWHCWKYKDPLYSPLSLALLCGITTLIVCDLFEPDRGRPLMQLLMVLAALIATIQSWIVPAFNDRTISPVRVQPNPRQQVA